MSFCGSARMHHDERKKLLKNNSHHRCFVHSRPPRPVMVGADNAECRPKLAKMGPATVGPIFVLPGVPRTEGVFT